MFKHQDEKLSTSARGGGKETVIADGVRVEGDFVSEGDMLIEGEVTGNIETRQNLRVGETAEIHANIKAKNAVIAGKVFGNLCIEETLELVDTSQIHGDIETDRFSVALGALLNGQVIMKKNLMKSSKDEPVDPQEEFLEA
ncbi:hypothetical protein CO172_00610 [Candidatus Uhrbacteria bacterium CG_4_9_14_3_um_filter_36_7]|uniref:Cell shape determination protein CcmA n=1 Tax=Candidatus Uhrbacteria bacterium CG_4_9_14_3_um_filter_36_7 TaxID=1975033 RepID=A0A2M7XI87_9BACT|nr:MAG: hypothetical protein CO172_00610 [Candidatus Uhrbacteria bacterium CG_4_9_14_3_um_filter_36_7]